MTDQPSFGLSQIGQIAIRVHDVERAVACYRDQLGLQYLFSFPGTAFFQCGNVRLMLSKPEKGEFDHPSSIIYFTIDDINAAYKRLSARGVHFEDQPHLIASMDTYDLWMVFFRDSEQNYLGLMSEVPRG